MLDVLNIKGQIAVFYTPLITSQGNKTKRISLSLMIASGFLDSPFFRFEKNLIRNRIGYKTVKCFFSIYL